MSRPAPPLEPDPEALRALTEQVTAFVLDHLGSLAEQPASDLSGAEALREAFREAAPEEGRPLAELLERLRPAIACSFNTAGPGYLAYMPGGGIYSAALAAFLADAVNRYVGVRGAAPVLSQIEETVVRWLADAMGYPEGADGTLTSGGSLANLTALITAREALLGEELSRAVIYTGEETHHSVAKAARLAGFPAAALRVLPVDERFRLRVDALRNALERDRADGRRPFLVVASAGTTSTGAVDPLAELSTVARRERLWLHADAAYGGFFRLVPAGSAQLRGLELCDSITLDPHKGLFLPYGTGCLLVRDGEALRRAHRVTAGYMQDLGEDTGFAERSVELSRRFRGLLVWLPVQLHGLAAFRDQLAEKLKLARWAAARLSAHPAFELLDEPQLSVVAFRLCLGSDEDAERLLQRVNARGRVFLSSTRIGGHYALRLCILSFRTHRDRVEEAVEALCEEAAALE